MIVPQLQVHEAGQSYTAHRRSFLVNRMTMPSHLTAYGHVPPMLYAGGPLFVKT
jgi:hypothetical protein